MSDAAAVDKIIACVPCREKKLKCVLFGQGPACQRCVAREIPCIRPQYQRIPKARQSSSTIDRDGNRSAQLEIPLTASAQSAAAASTSSTTTIGSTDDVSAFVGGPHRREDPSLHPLINPARLLHTTMQNSIVTQQQVRMYQARHDNHASLLPIYTGLLTEMEARRLYGSFSDSLDAYFDPAIHTYDYVMQSSALLFTTILWRASTSMQDGTASLREALFRHINEILLPSIYSHNYRSIEIIQALLLLSAYYPPSGELSEDRSWNLLGWAVRLATDLNIHSTITSSALSPTMDEAEYRQRRNAERTWINLWRKEVSLAQHTGRRSLLARDPIVLLCGNWHTQTHALKTDAELVALVELNAIIILHRSIYEEMMLDVPSNGAIRSFLGRCRHSLHLWYNRWRTKTAAAGGRLSSSSTPITSSQQLRLAPLYYRHALVQLIILPMQHAHLLEDATLSATIACINQHCLDYMESFLSLFPTSSTLASKSNSTFMTASYIVVLSLKMINLASSLSFIEPSVLLQMTTNVVARIRAVPNFAYQQTAIVYGNLLQMLIDQIRESQRHHGMDDSLSSSSAAPPFVGATTATLSQMQLQQHQHQQHQQQQQQQQIPHSSASSFTDMTDTTFVDPNVFLDDVELMAWVSHHFANTSDFHVV